MFRSLSSESPKYSINQDSNYQNMYVEFLRCLRGRFHQLSFREMLRSSVSFQVQLSQLRILQKSWKCCFRFYWDVFQTSRVRIFPVRMLWQLWLSWLPAQHPLLTSWRILCRRSKSIEDKQGMQLTSLLATIFAWNPPTNKR